MRPDDRSRVWAWPAFAAALLLACAAPPAAVAGIRSGAWSGDFSIPAFDGPVRACAIQNGYVVAGDFGWAGGVEVHNVARWSIGASDHGTGPPAAWVPMGAGLPMPVRRLAVWGTDLLAATSTRANECWPVMRYKTGAWRPLGDQLYGSAEALLANGLDLYVAGPLLQVGTTNDYRVMRWDGSAWQPIGGAFDGPILSLAVYQGDLYAGGEFLDAEGTFVSRIARWDGTHWQPVGGGTNAGGGIAVNALAVYGGRLIAGGYFSAMDGVPVRGIAAWNGASWDSLPEVPKDCFVTDLQVEGSLLHVAGVLQVPNRYAAGLVTFDGQTWNPPDPYPDWGLEDIAVDTGKLIAVGGSGTLNYGRPPYSQVPIRNVVVRETGWTTLAPWSPSMRGLLGPNWTQVSALHLHRGTLYAGGYFEYAATPTGWQYTSSLARWGNGGWEPVDQGTLHGWVNAIGSYGDRVAIGGAGFWTGTVVSSVLAWDGAAWSDLGGRLEGYVSGLAEWQGALVAVGGVRLPEQTAWSGVAIHRSAGWEILGEPLVNDQSSVTSVASFRGELFVGGSNLSVSGIGHGLVRWANDHWEPVPAPSGAVKCMLPRADGLWVAFYRFSLLDGPAVWRWDGVQWTAIGDLSGDPSALAEAGGEVFVGGALFGAHLAGSLAHWNGNEWVAVADAPMRGVDALAAAGDDLYVGGTFTRLGQGQAEAIARWSFQADGVLPVSGSIVSWPSPARDRVSFRFALPRQGRVTIALYDLKGARVAMPVDETLPAGYNERSWTIPSRRVPAGVYFARLTAPGLSSSAKVVIAP